MQNETTLFVTPEARGDVLILWIDNPPVNALGYGLRKALADGLAQAQADPSVGAIALLARGRSFPAGADISEFGKPPQPPLLPDLCNLIEASPKPVVAGLHGTALGGGLELALAAHARVALVDARVGLPEVTLGILPGAGGTQRLPRLIGAEQALRLMIDGQMRSAAQALAMGLVDTLVEANLDQATVAMAQELVGSTARPTRDRTDGTGDAKAYFAAVATARLAQAHAPIDAPRRIVDCVEAAQLLPFDQGLAFERAAFSELVASPQAQALRHVFFAERRAGRMVGAKAAPLDLAQVAVLGTQPDAVDLICGLLGAGLEVSLVDGDTDSLAKGLEAVALSLAEAEVAGRLSGAAHAAQWARLVPSLPGRGGIAADMLFLTGPYRLPDATLPDVPLRPGAPIVTLGRLGQGGARGLGLVLPAPTENGALAEVLIGPQSDAPCIATLLHLLRRMGRKVVQGQDAGLLAGLACALDASLRVMERLHGQAAVEEMLARWRRDAGPVDLWAGPVAAPVMGALANAGLQMIGDGRALRPSDIDLAMIMALGFPRWGGGPMLWAAGRGLMVLRDNLHDWQPHNPDLWAPAPLLEDLIRQDITLEDLNDA